jgi:phosphate transport system protein
MWTQIINLLKRDSLLTQSLHEAQTMLELDSQMFEASVESLRHSDTAEVMLDITATDKRVNASERDIRQKVLTHLAVAGTTELSAALNLVSVIYDIERIGDFTKGIHELARHHPGRLHGGSLELQVAEVEVAVRRLLQDAMDAFKTSDEEAARVIIAAYKQEIAAACDGVIRAIVSGKAADLAGADAATVALYVRFLKRIAAHARNVASSIVNPFPRLRYKEKAGLD